MGSHLRVLGESFPISTNKTGLRRFSKMFCVLVLRVNVVTALEGLRVTSR